MKKHTKKTKNEFESHPLRIDRAPALAGAFPLCAEQVFCIVWIKVYHMEKAESKVLLFIPNGSYSAVKVILTDALTRSFADWTIVPALSSDRPLAAKTLPTLLS